MPVSTLPWGRMFASTDSTLPKKGANRRDVVVSSSTVDTAHRWDADLPVEIARAFVDGQTIVDVVSRQRGGPVDIYFVVADRELGYRAAVPAIRKILAESSLALDFHYMEPGEVAPEA